MPSQNKGHISCPCCVAPECCCHRPRHRSFESESARRLSLNPVPLPAIFTATFHATLMAVLLTKQTVLDRLLADALVG